MTSLPKPDHVHMLPLLSAMFNEKAHRMKKRRNIPGAAELIKDSAQMREEAQGPARFPVCL